jgi:hypothetical protein
MPYIIAAITILVKDIRRRFGLEILPFLLQHHVCLRSNRFPITPYLTLVSLKVVIYVEH